MPQLRAGISGTNIMPDVHDSNACTKDEFRNRYFSTSVFVVFSVLTAVLTCGFWKTG